MTTGGSAESERDGMDPSEAMAASIAEQETRHLTWASVTKHVAVAVVAGLAIYLVFPSITEVFASWPRLATLNPIWLIVAVGAEVAHFACTVALQRLALRTKRWFVIVTAKLAGNAVTNIIPAGAAAGAAVEYRMLSRGGVARDRAIGGLTAFSLLSMGGLLALPIFTLPAILFGAPVSRGLQHTAFVGIGAFVIFAVLGAVVLATDGPLVYFGRVVQRGRNWLFRKRTPIRGLDSRVLRERDAIKSVLGTHWLLAVALTAGRLFFDYACLLAALRATGSQPRPSVVLLAYAVAEVIRLLPITPGGLGIVEASISGLLILAGVNASEAFLATLVYRLASYWLPLLAGPIAYLAYYRRYGRSSVRA